MPRVTITIPEKNAQPYRFQLDRQSVTLGRGSENDIAIDCGSVSVKHAEMLRVDGGYELRDLGSTNGIKLDGERLDVIPLRSGITVKLGDVAFDFMLSDEEREALAREKPAEESPITREPVGLPPLVNPVPQRAAPVPEASEGMGFGSILLFVILAVAAFFAGVAFRFQKETGNSLLETIKERRQTMSAPANPASRTPSPAPAEDSPR